MIFIAAASCYTAARYLLQINDGGHVWTTGDWLLSYRAGFVRRGLTGSITYGLTDWTGINALYVAVATQLLVFGALVAVVLFILSRLEMTVPVAILALSPAFVLMEFYILKLAGSKELIGFLCVALVGLTAFLGRKWPLWVGTGLFAASGFAHEINAFLAPDLLALLLILSLTGVVPRAHAMIAAGVVVVAAAAAILTSMIYNGNGMGDAICQVMLSYGGKPEFCGHQGPIFWLERDMAYGMQFTWDANVVSGVWPWFILGFVLSMAPFLLFRVKGDENGQRTRRVLLAAFAGIVTFAPLFVIASDWGRWIAMHTFCLTILTYVCLRLGIVEERHKNLSPVFLVFSLVWAMPDYGAPLTTGALQKVVSLANHIANFGAP